MDEDVQEKWLEPESEVEQHILSAVHLASSKAKKRAKFWKTVTGILIFSVYCGICLCNNCYIISIPIMANELDYKYETVKKPKN